VIASTERYIRKERLLLPGLVSRQEPRPSWRHAAGRDNDHRPQDGQRASPLPHVNDEVTRQALEPMLRANRAHKTQKPILATV
jgi:hypothetical protein